MRKFISVAEYGRLHNVSVSAVNYRIRKGEVPYGYLRLLRSTLRPKKVVQGIREDYVIQVGRKKSTYDHRELTHTVYLPGGIKKVLQPHEYKNNRWRNKVVV